MILPQWLRQLEQHWSTLSARYNNRRRVVLVPGLIRHRLRPRLEVLEDRCLLAATITDLGVLPGDTGSRPTSINAFGQVVGDSFPNSSGAFLYSNGQMTNLGTLPGDTLSDATGINASGQVVGDSISNSSSGSIKDTSHAFLYSNGQMTDLGTLPGFDAESHASGINDAGQVVGVSVSSNGSTISDHAFLYSNGQMTDLNTLLPANSGWELDSATAINDAGQIVGGGTINGQTHSYLYSNGQITDLGTLPGDTVSSVTGINASGQVVVDSYSGNGSTLPHAFLYSNGQTTDLGALPGDDYSGTTGINDSGQVVGYSGSSSSHIEHVFLYSNGQMTDLNTLLPANSGWELDSAIAINDAGQIVGEGTINGQAHAYLLNLNLSGLSLSPPSLAVGVVNSSYTQSITANGGTGDKTLTYKITTGVIPTGLTFTPKTNELDISGTPTTAGTVTFTVTATDSASPPNSTSQTYTLTVNAIPPTATITDLGVLPGDTVSFAYGINDSGQVVGSSSISINGPEHAFLYSNGQMTDLGTLPGDTSSGASAINASGQVVGNSSTSNHIGHAFLYSNGQMTDLGTLPGDTDSLAFGINASGQVVGASFSSDGSEHAYLYSNGQMTDLGTLPGGTNSQAIGINASGQVVGDSGTSNSLSLGDAFLYSNGQMTDLGTLLGDGASTASGINASGQVVGDSFSSAPDSHAFLFSNGQMTTLETLPGDTEIDVTGINDSGQVVGSALSSSKIDYVFLYSNGQTVDLSTLLPANSGWTLEEATAINDSGQIVGWGFFNGQHQAFLLNLNLAGLSLSPSSLAVGVVNSSYTQSITASGGTGDKTLTYKINTGVIPTGLTFTPKTNELDISGTPSVTGTVTFTVTATDSASPPNSTSQTYTLTINAATPPVITANPTAPPAAPALPTLNVPPLLAFFDSLFVGTEAINTDGTVTVTDSIFGFPLLVATFDASGKLVGVDLFGIDVTFLFG